MALASSEEVYKMIHEDLSEGVSPEDAVKFADEAVEMDEETMKQVDAFEEYVAAGVGFYDALDKAFGKETDDGIE